MPTITIGLDLAKHVFQVHGVDATGQVVIRKKLRRSELLEFFKELPPCLVGMEACGTAHHWGLIKSQSRIDQESIWRNRFRINYKY